MTEIEYDNQIWTTFSVGVVSSVIILYYFHKGEIPEGWGIWALALGFSVLVYSFILILGYGVKKSIHLTNEDVFRSWALSRKWYPRVRWMAEIIMILIGIYYFVSFFPNLGIPIIIILIALVLCCLANCCVRRNQR